MTTLYLDENNLYSTNKVKYKNNKSSPTAPLFYNDNNENRSVLKIPDQIHGHGSILPDENIQVTNLKRKYSTNNPFISSKLSISSSIEDLQNNATSNIAKNNLQIDQSIDYSQLSRASKGSIHSVQCRKVLASISPNNNNINNSNDLFNYGKPFKLGNKTNEKHAMNNYNSPYFFQYQYHSQPLQIPPASPSNEQPPHQQYRQQQQSQDNRDQNHYHNVDETIDYFKANNTNISNGSSGSDSSKFNRSGKNVQSDNTTSSGSNTTSSRSNTTSSTVRKQQEKNIRDSQKFSRGLFREISLLDNSDSLILLNNTLEENANKSSFKVFEDHDDITSRTNKSSSLPQHKSFDSNSTVSTNEIRNNQLSNSSSPNSGIITRVDISNALQCEPSITVKDPNLTGEDTRNSHFTFNLFDDSTTSSINLINSIQEEPTEQNGEPSIDVRSLIQFNTSFRKSLPGKQNYLNNKDNRIKILNSESRIPSDGSKSASSSNYQILRHSRPASCSQSIGSVRPNFINKILIHSHTPPQNSTEDETNQSGISESSTGSGIESETSEHSTSRLLPEKSSELNNEAKHVYSFNKMDYLEKQEVHSQEVIRKCPDSTAILIVLLSFLAPPFWLLISIGFLDKSLGEIGRSYKIISAVAVGLVAVGSILGVAIGFGYGLTH